MRLPEKGTIRNAHLIGAQFAFLIRVSLDPALIWRMSKLEKRSAI